MIKQRLSRRTFVAGASLAALALVMAPHMVRADAKAVEDELKKLFGGKPIAEGRVKLDVPQIAENGLVVPLNVDVESPMTDKDYVKAVHVFADGNPSPHVISYRFTPSSGRASASNRIRLAKTQNIIAVAEMSDGSLHMAKSEVKVTIGGCGG
ncbi:MAG: thiosulfate oxidation carrier protein SoxY [Rhodomicrobium sp.]|nr:thiosulfate oxidation carrier protein SoxY [Rhodomicrobium sp.]